ncbi:exported protein of unknown function [Magnetospirillum gryphiswaldense MSR-1 v2]|uniref:Uncharacterized protein n=1 Tax=Magnetospirillum gryphiswaldense (strain DSM 6361 / JCM 21280 / NBRC 15271 / MSR-1) TaxID=431944 RepID=V6F8T0_MAGGM|nr:hypothetical protein [Magnetospirillum gryphiswaldense]CDL01081.1 exported protein of unknown function [Magnetospirillum gryphiswaldense MSR-1 v2]
MRVYKLILPALVLLALPAHAAPIRCGDDGEGGACVWGRVEGYDGGSVQIRGLTVHVAGIVVPPRRDLCQNKTTKSTFDCAKPARKRMGELLSKGVACDILECGRRHHPWPLRGGRGRSGTSAGGGRGGAGRQERAV